MPKYAKVCKSMQKHAKVGDVKASPSTALQQSKTLFLSFWLIMSAWKCKRPFQAIREVPGKSISDKGPIT